MAAPTYFHSASNPADNGAQGDNVTLDCTPPASMAVGDLVIFIGMIRMNPPGTALAISATGGQSWSGASTVDENNIHNALFWCRFNGSWSANPSIVFANESGTNPCSVIMHVFRPATNSIWTLDTAMAGAAEVLADPVVITGITPAHNDNVVLAGWLVPNASTWTTITGAGWAVVETAQYRNTTGSDQSAAYGYQVQGTRGATGDTSLKPSTAVAGASFTMAWYATAITPIDATPSEDNSTSFGEAMPSRFNFRASASESSLGMDDATSGQFKYFASFASAPFVPADQGSSLLPILASNLSTTVPASDAVTAALALLVNLTANVSTGLVDDVSASTPAGGVKLYWNDSVAALERDLAQVADSLLVDDAGGLSVQLVQLAQLSDSFTGGDSASALQSFLGQITDNTAGTDSATALQVFLAQLSDNFSGTEAVNSLFNFLAQNSDTVALSDDITGLMRQLADLTDDFSSALADLVVATLVEMSVATPINVPASDDVSLGLADTVSALFNFLALTSESLTYTDLMSSMMNYQASMGEADPGMTDSVAALQRLLAVMDDLLPLSDSAMALLPMLAVMADTLGMDDLASGLHVYRSSISDNFALADVVDALQRQLAQISDSVPASDLLSALFNFLATPADSVSPIDSATAQQPYLGSASEDLGLADNILGLMVHRAILGEDVGSLLADLVTIILIQVGIAFPLTFSFDDDVSLGLSDSLAGLLRDLAQASETLTYQDVADAVGRVLAGISDSLTPLDNASALQPILGQPSDDAGIHDDIGGLFNYLAQIGDNEGANLADQIVARLIIAGAGLDVRQRIRIGNQFIDGFAGWSR